MRIKCVRYATGVWKWEITVAYAGLWPTLWGILLPFYRPKEREMTFLGKRAGLWYKMPNVEKVDEWTTGYLDDAVRRWLAGLIPEDQMDCPRRIPPIDLSL